jgi:hypothetical protein
MARSLNIGSRADLCIPKTLLGQLMAKADQLGLLTAISAVPQSKTRVFVQCWGNPLPLQTFIAEAYRHNVVQPNHSHEQAQIS